jgi:hypothetical protein
MSNLLRKVIDHNIRWMQYYRARTAHVTIEVLRETTTKRREIQMASGRLHASSQLINYLNFPARHLYYHIRMPHTLEKVSELAKQYVLR